MKTRRPLAAPAARPLAYLLALALLVFTGIAVHDALARTDVIARDELLSGAADSFSGRDWSAYLLPASIAAVVVGLVLLFIAVKPRRSTHVRANSTAQIWLRPLDVGRVAALAARRCPGILRASATTTPKQLQITADGGGPDVDELPDQVTRAVTPIVAAAVEDPPDIRVRLSGAVTNDDARGRRERGRP